jgi:hypothetical protein
VHVSVIWRFLRGASELIYISLCTEKDWSNYAKTIMRHYTEFGSPGDKVLRICAPLHCHYILESNKRMYLNVCHYAVWVGRAFV